MSYLLSFNHTVRKKVKIIKLVVNNRLNDSNIKHCTILRPTMNPCLPPHSSAYCIYIKVKIFEFTNIAEL